MIFHSLDFAAFFLIVVAIYWRLSHRGQNLLLLAASYVFYGCLLSGVGRVLHTSGCKSSL